MSEKFKKTKSYTLKKIVMMTKITTFLGNHKLLWVPLAVSILAMWIFGGTFGFLKHAELQSEIGGEVNMLTIILGICAISYLIVVVMFWRSLPDHEPELVLIGISFLLFLPVFSMIVCGAGLIPSVLLTTHFTDYGEFFSDTMIEPGPTFMAAGVILINYFLLGVFLEITYLPFRLIKIRRKRKTKVI